MTTRLALTSVLAAITAATALALAAPAFAGAPIAAIRPKVPPPTPAQTAPAAPVVGDVSLGLAGNDVLVIVRGDAAERIRAAMTGATPARTDAGNPWSRGKQVGCRKEGDATECRFAVARNARASAPTRWADSEPSGTFSRLNLDGTASVDATPKGISLRIEGPAATGVGLFSYKARSAFACAGEADMGSKVFFVCGVVINPKGAMSPLALP